MSLGMDKLMRHIIFLVAMQVFRWVFWVNFFGEQSIAMWYVLDKIAVAGCGECMGSKLFLMNFIGVYLVNISDVFDGTKGSGTH